MQVSRVLTLWKDVIGEHCGKTLVEWGWDQISVAICYGLSFTVIARKVTTLVYVA